MPTKKQQAAAVARGRRYYDALLSAQGGSCALCGRKPGERRLHVDHDHATLVVRGLLCWWCNQHVIGRRGVTAEHHRRAAEYLDNPPAPPVLAALEGGGE